MLNEFKAFAIKGNMVELAIGVIIGAAFGAIVSSLVADVMMPLIGLIFGGLDFSNWFIVLSDTGGETIASVAQAKELGIATLNIGLFINAIVKFLIIAWVLFFVVRGINSMRRKEEEKPSTPPSPTKEETLLTEIRDLLATK